MIDPKRQKIIQIDIDARNASWTTPANVVLVGDANLTIKCCLIGCDGAIDQAGRGGADQELRHVARCQRFLARQNRDRCRAYLSSAMVREVQEAAPDSAIICSDAGNNRHWMNHYFQTKRANSYFGLAVLGGVSWSMAATLAAKIVHPERPAIGVCSDGGFRHANACLFTALQYNVAPI